MEAVPHDVIQAVVVTHSRSLAAFDVTRASLAFRTDAVCNQYFRDVTTDHNSENELRNSTKPESAHTCRNYDKTFEIVICLKEMEKIRVILFKTPCDN